MEEEAEEPVRRRVLVLLNPCAGQGQALDEAQKHLAGHRSLKVEVLAPDPTDHDAQMAHARAAVQEGVDAVVVHGGDGMVSAGLNLLDGRRIPIGVVPAGTGNDFARAVGIPRRRPAEALELILAALEQPTMRTMACDALHLRVTSPGDESPGAEPTDRLVINSVNIGFDARVNQRANSLRRFPGALRYIAALAQVVPGFRSVPFDVGLDGEPRMRRHSALVCVQNGPFIGGGIPLAPGAELDDGAAEVSLVGPLSRPGLVALFPLLYLKQHDRLKPLSTQRITHLSVHVPAGVPVFADGEEIVSGGTAGSQVEAAAGSLVEVAVDPGAVALLQ